MAGEKDEKTTHVKKGDHLKIVTVQVTKSLTEILRDEQIDPEKVLAFFWEDIADKRHVNKLMREKNGELQYHETELILNHAELFRNLLRQSIKKEKRKHPKK